MIGYDYMIDFDDLKAAALDRMQVERDASSVEAAVQYSAAQVYATLAIAEALRALSRMVRKMAEEQE